MDFGIDNLIFLLAAAFIVHGPSPASEKESKTSFFERRDSSQDMDDPDGGLASLEIDRGVFTDDELQERSRWGGALGGRVTVTASIATFTFFVLC